MSGCHCLAVEMAPVSKLIIYTRPLPSASSVLYFQHAEYSSLLLDQVLICQHLSLDCGRSCIFIIAGCSIIMKLFKKTLSNKSLAGPGYVILNVLRAMNIVAMVAVIGASILMLIKTTINSNFFFFGAFTHVVVASVAGLRRSLTQRSN